MTIKWVRTDNNKYSVKLGSINGHEYELLMKFMCDLDDYKHIVYSIYKDSLLIRRNIETISLIQSFNNYFIIGDITYNVRKFIESEGIICTDVLQL